MDIQIRTAAFTRLEQLTLIHGDVLPWEILHKGFDFMGQQMELPLSITTSRNSPYNDAFTPDDLLKYNYRG